MVLTMGLRLTILAYEENMKYILFLIPMIALGDFRKVETIREYIYDFSVSGGTSNTFIDVSTAATGTTLMPTNAVIESIDFRVITPLVSSLNSSITFGNSTAISGYMAPRAKSDFTDNAFFVGDGSLIWDATNKFKKMFLTDDTNDRNIGMTISSGTSVTAGKILIKVKSYTWGLD
jgi:hypothetical protein